MWQVFVYAAAVALALSVAGCGVEKIAAHKRWPRRFVWAGVMTVSLVLPLCALWRTEGAAPPAPTIVVQGAAGVGAASSPAASSVDQMPGSIEANASRHGASVASGSINWKRFVPPDRMLLAGWIAISTLLAAYLAAATLLLFRRASTWESTKVNGQDVLVSESTGPALLGVLRPRVIVPRWFFDVAPATQTLILAHEHQHRAARDPMLLWIAVMAAVLVPWNLPLWWQLRRLRGAIEIDCDARVIGGGADPAGYGAVLLAAARRATSMPMGVVAMSEPVSTLEKRIMILMADSVKQGASRATLAAGLTLAGIAAAMALEAPPMPSASTDRAEQASLPLIPTPTAAGEMMMARRDVAIQRAAERYPEIVQGAEREEKLIIAVVLRPDGTLLDSQMRRPGGLFVNDLVTDMKQAMQVGGWTLHTSALKGTKLADGRALRTDVMLVVMQQPAGGDGSRAVARVNRIVLERHADLLLPSSGGEMNQLTVLMSEDGTIAREHVQRVRPGDRDSGASGPADHTTRLAQRIAAKLDLDTSQIGVMGTTTIEAGLGRSADAAGALSAAQRVDRKYLTVHYAWARRAGETAPSLAASLDDLPREVDLGALLRVVEHLFPDAFINKDPSAGRPTLVLTNAGAVIRAGWVKAATGVAVSQSVEEQLSPGVKVGSMRTEVIRNSAGERVMVQLGWEIPAVLAAAGLSGPG